MFDNIGGKIKTLAQVVCWIGIIFSVFSGIAIIVEDNFVFLGFIYIVIGPLASWASSFVLYGLGEIINQLEYSNSNTYNLYQLLKKIAPKDEKKIEPQKSNLTSSAPTVQKTATDGWVCKKCSAKNDSCAQFCKDCGTYK